MKWLSVVILALSTVASAAAIAEMNVVVFPDIPSTTFTYDFIFSDSSACGVLLNRSVSITTNLVGRGNATLDTSPLTYPPAYLCTYRNGLLVNRQSLNANVFEAGNVTVSNGSSGYPAIFTSATNIASGLISANMITQNAINASLLNATNAGTSGQVLALNANLGQFTWVAMVSSALTDALYVNITNLQTSNASLTARINTINTSIDNLYVNLTNVQTSSASTNTRINTINQTTQDLINSNTSTNTRINTINSSYLLADAVINNTIATQGTNISNLQTSNTSTNTRIDTINASKGNLSMDSNGTAGYLAKFTGTDNSNNSALYQNSSGAFMIGGTAPNATLHVVGNANITTTIYTQQICLFGICSSGPPGNISSANASAGYVPYFTNLSNLNTSSIFIEANGSVGIGTNSANNSLDIQGNASTTENLLVGGALSVGGALTVFGNITAAEIILNSKGYPYADGTPEYWNPYTLEFTNCQASSVDPFIGATTSAATFVAQAGSATHPGICRISDSATANANYRVFNDVNSFLVNGTERARFIFRVPANRSTASCRFGFQDSTAIQTLPTDGIYLNYSATSLTASTANNSIRSTNATQYGLALNTWYNGYFIVNNAATNVEFNLYNENQTALLWNVTLMDRIPVIAGRETGFGIICGESSVDVAQGITDLDFMGLQIRRQVRQ